MKVGFLFNGQGAQCPGMGKDIYDHFPLAATFYRQVHDATGVDVAQLSFQASEESIKDSRTAQLCLLALEMSIFQILRQHTLHPHIVAGFSFGEYPALIAAGALPLDDGIRLVLARGTLMSESAARKNGAMALIEGLPRQALQRLMTPLPRVYIACHNTKTQFFVAGEKEEIEQLVSTTKARGLTALVLPVGGAFHSPYIADAALRFQEILRTISFTSPRIPVIGNVHATPMTTTEEIAADTAAQMLSPVAWHATIVKMLELGTNTFIEIGPGHGLSAMVRKIDRQAEVMLTRNTQELGKVLTRFARN
ncbi:MAG: hypothetical protein BWK76_02630 [Desulfobulbaceae bacterium A2]|nr:MAG: hypothetical protein BWK76_02630 [Desulfobulbaceae bacterium A2]